MSEIEVLEVKELKVNVECDWCGFPAKFEVTLREYADGAFQEVGNEDTFDLCKICRKNALDNYLEFLQRMELGHKPFRINRDPDDTEVDYVSN